MSKQSHPDALSVLGLSPGARTERGIDPTEVRDALVAVIGEGTREEKVIEGCSFPALDLRYHDLDGSNNYPVVFRGCTFAGEFDAEHADVKLPVRFEDCTFADVSLGGARFEYDLAFADCTFEGETDVFEARFDRDATFEGATFQTTVRADEATFADDASFAGATFESDASFRAAEFAGKSNLLEDHASFAHASFAAEAAFEQARFEHATFEGTEFDGPARFQDAIFDGDVAFVGAAFGNLADFDEVAFRMDADFEAVSFAAKADFRGATFEGGARTLEDDARFVEAAFHGEADFEAARFRYANFGRAAFSDLAHFQHSRFDADADFDDARFSGVADFDEARFREDADFSGAVFESQAVFRGAEFRGDANHLEDNATFADASFGDDADFDNAVFTSANYRGTEFAGIIDFTGASFTDRADFAVVATDEDPYVNLTGASIRTGTITQPEDGWVRYDFTRASIGDVSLSALTVEENRELLDYFRICNTTFDEFDGHEFEFADHVAYLDRNDWNLHEFADYHDDREYAEELTPETVETTYLKAKKSASAAGEMKAAGEFRVKRQEAARRKHLAIVRDPETDPATRARNVVRAAENKFLGVTCGHGMRLFRILVAFLVVPLLPALLYAFGGPAFRTGAGQLTSLGQLATPEGQAIMYKSLHFSYITFLTIGYGGIGPQGALARLMAGLEVYVSIVLGGLVLYALIKRSEI